MTENGLPEGWNLANIGDVATLNMGQSPPSSTYNRSAHGLPFLQGKADFGDVYPTPKMWCSQPIKIANADDVLISVRAPVGDVNVARGDCCIGRGLAALKPSDAADPWFLFFALRRIEADIDALGSGTTFRSINKSALAAVRIPLPPLPEQRGIAEVLRSVQDARATAGSVLAAGIRWRESAMRHTFTYGPVRLSDRAEVTLAQPLVQGHQWPNHWPVTTLRHVARIESGQVDPRVSPYREMLHVGPENISQATGRLSGCAVAKDLNLRSGKYLFGIQHVLYSKIRPYLRKAALAEGIGICSADMYAITPIETSREFLMYWLLSEPFTAQAISHQARTGIPKINRVQLESTILPLPPLSEQREIVNILSAIDAKIEAEEAKVAALDVVFKTLLHELMTGQRRVGEFSEVAA